MSRTRYGAPTTKTPTPIPNAAWIEWRGRRWAADRNCLVRDDCPSFLPYAGAEWLTWNKPSVVTLDCLVMPDSTKKPPAVLGWVEPLVRAAASVRWGTATSPIWLLDKADEPMAIIMPASWVAKKVEPIDEMFARTRETR